MRSITAQWIANAVGGTLVADVDIAVTSVVKDSRDATPGALYVALRGERVDGHDFVHAAAQGGAVLHLVEDSVDVPHIMVDDAVAALGALARAYLADLRLRCDITVIGITGSNGKTTTKDLLAQVLPDVVAPVGSYNNEIGMPLTVLRADDTTRHLVLEMGASGVGHIAYLTDIAPLDVAVVLMVGSAHLGEYESLDQVAQAKAEILAGVVPGGTAILNHDDSRVRAMSGLVRDDVTVVTFGTLASAQVRATDTTMDGAHARFGLVTPEGTVQPVTLTLVGRHHLTNAMAAICVGRACGIDVCDVAATVAAAGPVSAHRMALSTRADGVTVLDDSYNASAESMKAALQALKLVAGQGRSIAVIGEIRELGDDAVSTHAEIGHQAVRLGIDHLVVVGDGAKAVYDSAVREGSWGEEAHFVATIDQALSHVESVVRAGDTVLVKASHGSELWKLADALLGEHRT